MPRPPHTTPLTIPGRALSDRAITGLWLVLVLAGLPVRAQVPHGPDLRLEWLVDGKPRTQAPAIEGPSGTRVTVSYRLGNNGDRDAFAVVLRAFTALGPFGAAERVEPGPAAGRHHDRSFTLVLSEGMRELCLEARLQNRAAGDPPDPRPQDNRICRRIHVPAPEVATHRQSVNRAAHHRRTPHATPRS